MESLLVDQVRKWEDLNTDCLIKVFEKVGLESVFYSIPFVCMSWYKASLDPMCYKVLNFDEMIISTSTIRVPDYSMPARKKFRISPPSTEFIKIAVNRSRGLATEVVFPKFLRDYSYNILEYVLERCPALKTLTLPDYTLFIKEAREAHQCLVKMIRKLKHLESLMLKDIELENPKEILNQIHIHCPNFVSLASERAFIHQDIASEIVTLLPNIKHLVLRDSYLDRGSLLLILSGCRKLELLDVTNCIGIGFDVDDPVILTSASHIKNFISER